MKIATFDLATNTGVCVGDSGGDPSAWSVYLGGSPDARRFANVLKLVEGVIEKNEPDMIVVEAAIGGKQASQYLIGLMQCARGQAYKMGVPCETANIATVRKHFLGIHLTKQHYPHMSRDDATDAIKQEVIKRCRLFGWAPKDDDCADAMSIWDWSVAEFARVQPKPIGGLFNGKV